MPKKSIIHKLNKELFINVFMHINRDNLYYGCKNIFELLFQIRSKKYTNYLSIIDSCEDPLIKNCHTEIIKTYLEDLNIRTISTIQLGTIIKKLLIPYNYTFYEMNTFNTKQKLLTNLKIKNKIIYCSSNDNTLKIFNLDGVLLMTIIHNNEIWAYNIYEETDKIIIVSGSVDKVIKITHIKLNLNNQYQPMKLINQNELKRHKSIIRVIHTMEQNGKILFISGSRDSSICIFDKYGFVISQFSQHHDSIRCIQSIDGYLITGSYDGTVRMYNCAYGFENNSYESRTQKIIQSLGIIHEHDSRIYTINIYKGLNFIVIASAGLGNQVYISKIKYTIINQNMCIKKEFIKNKQHIIFHVMNAPLISWVYAFGKYILAISINGEIVKYNRICEIKEANLQINSIIKCTILKNEMLYIGTISGLLIVSLKVLKIVNTLYEDISIVKLDCENDNLIVGYLNEHQETTISILKYKTVFK
ncbi:hypothetical protein EBI_27475 [Enterocytozoon bieneusi H348]|nr:hypothetical protein EBI_27475 [Enterocytozoon bieneusi H348]|eukprot:XP_002649426.1 hypothetical protein EBI_27475 [Enterocytozoon bieneusi H348]